MAVRVLETESVTETREAKERSAVRVLAIELASVEVVVNVLKRTRALEIESLMDTAEV
jgi:hypothetical protein